MCVRSAGEARFHLDSWQLTPAYEALQRIEDCDWAHNRLYYQEWLLLHCRLQSMSWDCDHDQNDQTLLEALRISRPDIDLSDFQGLLLTQNELHLLSAIARESLSLDGQISVYRSIPIWNAICPTVNSPTRKKCAF